MKNVIFVCDVAVADRRWIGSMRRKKMIKLTELEKQIITELGDSLYTVEFVEAWINRSDNVIINPFAALQAMGAKGYHQAVKRMAALRGAK